MCQTTVPKPILGGGHMYHIGIDISKYKHNCHIATDTGALVKAFVFNNDKEGFHTLLCELKALGDPHLIKVGFESTGHYGINLKSFISHAGYTYIEFNPYQTSQFSKTLSLRAAKTDKIDAEVISMMFRFVDYEALHQRFYHIDDLKCLVRLRNTYIEERSKVIVRLTNTLDKVFPEFKPFFNHHLGPVALYILKTYLTKDKISHLSKRHYETLHNLSRGKFTYAKFNLLKQLANDSIGVSSTYLDHTILLAIKHVFYLDQLLKPLEEDITSLFQLTDSKLSTIPGLGVIQAATLYAEIGDIKRFDSPSKLISYAGLKVRIMQSGQMDRTGHLVKRGSSLLRKTIWNYAFLSLRFIPTINDFYHKKRAEGKHHKVVLIHVCRKLLRMIYHLEFYQEDYNDNLFK